MHYLVSYEIPREVRDKAQERFKSGGALPPDGVTMVARWHHTSGTGGFAIAETSDAVALGKWAQDWSDLLVFTISPIVNDEQIQEVMS